MITEETKTNVNNNYNNETRPVPYRNPDAIDLLELLYECKRRWWAILICVVVLGGVLGAYCHFLIPNSYQADASIYITSSDSLISFSDLQLSSALTQDYENIIKSRHVLVKVINNLGLKVDYATLYNMVSVANPEDSHIIKINVTCEVPEDAVTIANEIMHVSVEEIYQVVGSGEPSVLDQSEAEYVTNVKPSTTRYFGMGALLGLVLSCGVIAIRVIMDTTIKTEEDVAMYLGLPVLAVIPINGKEKYGYGYGRRKSKGGAKA